MKGLLIGGVEAEVRIVTTVIVMTNVVITVVENEARIQRAYI